MTQGLILLSSNLFCRCLKSFVTPPGLFWLLRVRMLFSLFWLIVCSTQLKRFFFLSCYNTATLSDRCYAFSNFVVTFSSLTFAAVINKFSGISYRICQIWIQQIKIFAQVYWNIFFSCSDNFLTRPWKSSLFWRACKQHSETQSSSGDFLRKLSKNFQKQIFIAIC